MGISEQIKNRRKELGITQEELAEMMGYKSKSSINKIESGENDIPQSKIVKFAECLHCSVADLMGWNQDTIDAVSKQQEESYYFMQDDERIQKFIIDIRNLDLTDAEFDNLYVYAKWIVSNRKDDNT